MRFITRFTKPPSRALLGAAAAITLASTAANGQRPTFYADDPIAQVVDTQNASNVQPKEVNLIYDEARNLLGNPGDPDMDRRAQSINTIDEVPDSTWFTNRIIGGTPLTVADVVKGPDTGTGPAPGKWTVVSGKSDGITPGFTILDSAGDRWFIKFDPPNHRELASSAEVVVTQLFHALGYNVPENHITNLTRENLAVGDRATVTAADGGERRLTGQDVDRLLRIAAQEPDGSYRVLASKALAGKPLGPFLYVGTRPDDPNDVIPHEHRRELRALRVFAAWTNHVDSKSINSLDMLVTANGRAFVRHHLIDFGSTLGSASIKPREYDEGHHYIFDPVPTLKGMIGLGLYIPSFHLIDYPDLPSVGHFSADRFDPPEWKPRVPNPAFRRARPDDTFWGARRVMAFTDEMIRAVVKKGQYSDPAAEKHVADTLIARRDAIGRSWLTAVNPVIDPSLDASGALSFRNAAVAAGVAPAPASYEVAWFTFDNASGTATPIGQPVTTGREGADAPAGLPAATGSFVRVDIKAAAAAHPSWAVPVRAYFRRTGGSWKLVGFERMPDNQRR
ncbi:MAG TPA: hypothetical protein VJ813_07930 [Vicinamibacterales bacterium]|nr:hypothetical protein [Vicinamibacterales bacterium]